MAYGSDPNASKTRSTAIWLGLFFVAALALRVAFSIGIGHDDASGREIFTGNDPYYHDRTLRHLMETGKNLNYDEAINYPDGRSNPNPPLFIWTTAPLALALDAAGTEDPTGTALNWMTGIWGALTILPVFLIARDLWGRTAGLWAAFFTAISAPHIQRSVWGYADHDAITMFLITLAFAFMVKAFRALTVREYVSTWGKAEARMAGLKQSFAANRRAFLWAALAGVALTATALVWKGYPYALAVMAIGCGVQLVADHLRNRDSTATFGLYLLPLVMVVVLPWLLYYRMFPGFLAGTVWPSLYVLLGVIVAGLILVPTREIPSIVVFPGLLVAGLVGLALLIWVFPAAGKQVFSGLGYFEQSKLYTTIAEAQRAQLGFVAASFGLGFTFLLGFGGFWRSLKGAWKGDAALTLMMAWGLVAIFMAFAASRFIMNAVPIFSIYIGVCMGWLFGKLGLSEVSRRFRGMHGQGMGTRATRSLSAKAVIGVILVAFFFILPNVWFGVDAATSSEFDSDHGLTDNDPDTVDRFGAFGISFDLRDNGWLDTMAYLAEQDTDVPLEDRPAVISWWDYGHWNVGIGQHPTVADPFQSHYELAGRFLASESEEEAMSWLIILLVDYDHNKDGPGFSSDVAAALDDASPGLSGIITPADGYDKQYDELSAKVNGTAVFDLYEDVKEATGKDVGYMAADIRMWPFDARSSGIFYAPVFLANKNPDDFLTTQLRSGNTVLTVHQYAMDEGDNSYRLEEPKYVDANGIEWVVYQGYAYRPGATPLDGEDPSSGIPLFQGNEQLIPTQKFTNSMYTRAYGSYDGTQPAGRGLTHWRVVQQSVDDYFGIPDARQSVLLQYYHGVEVSGRVLDESGAPMPGVTVSFVDGTGASHGSAVADEQGRYTVLAPFSQDGDLSLSVLSAGQPIYSDNRSALQFTFEEAQAGGQRTGIDLTVPSADLSGLAFEETDGKAGFNASTDRLLPGVQVTAAGKTATTGADGRYTLNDIPAGSHSATATLAGYNNATQTVLAKAGETTGLDFQMSVKQSPVTLRFEDAGQPVGQVPMNITGGSLTAPRQVTTNGTGVTQFPVNLSPGTYHVSVDHPVQVNGTTVTYRAEQDFTVPTGGAPMTVVVARQN